MKILAIIIVIYLLIWSLNYISYFILKNRILKLKKWGLNICCGKTNGNGINADIIKHKQLPNFVIVDVYSLPFKDNQFETVLSSHTIEHLTDPDCFYKELQRVGNNVTLVIPPLWDISAVLNVLEHRWIFLSFRKVHNDLPRYVPLPLSKFIQKYFGQKLSA